jgi:hypothetical protein
MNKYKPIYNFRIVLIISVITGSLLGILMSNTLKSSDIIVSIIIGLISMFILVSIVYIIRMSLHNANIRFGIKVNHEYELYSKKEIADREYSKSLNLINRLIKNHSRALNAKWHQLVIKDAYGNIDFDDFQKEVEYFYERVFLPAAFSNNIDLEKAPIGLEKFIFLFNEASTKVPGLFEEINYYEGTQMTPIEFENLCCSQLINNGWDARTTKGSGDQGVDIVAEKSSIKAVFQCKYYSNPVGNKAVQEIAAGKQYELADIAAVISNSRYTKSAEQLAKTCDVLLIHFSELDNFDSLLKEYI